VSPQAIPFVDHGTTQQSANDGGPKLVVATDLAQTGLGDLATSAQSGRLFIAVFAGNKRTGGFAVQVERVERDGDRVMVHARFTEPPPGALLIQVLTSPAHLVSIDRALSSGVREAVLLDQQGAEVTRSAMPQSQT
jgi:protease stability complex PrcB-like protein